MKTNDSPFMLASYPRAIVHLDGDAFFASVEQALTPSLRGKPVVTGRERGIIACASYEAKAAGVRRGLPLHEARRLCPGLVILPSDYETYSIYSKRMFSIMRKYTPVVEEYSVDEGFADITGMRRIFRASYEQIAANMQRDVGGELGITVSVGLSLSKSLAKLCSKFRKPRGFTAVPGNYIHILLQRTPLEKVWGFGPNTVHMLQKFGFRTAFDFASLPESRAGRLLNKPGRDIWNELRGNPVWEVTTEEKTPQATILKSKTFTPPSTDANFVFARLVRNAEAAFAKARRHRLRAGAVGVVLRRQDFGHDGLEARFSRPTSSPLEAIPLIRALFDRLFAGGTEYRATLIVLGRLESDRAEQPDLFEDRLRIENIRSATAAADTINARYGKHAVSSATSLFLGAKPATPRDDAPARRRMAFRGETDRQRIGIPRLEIKV
jgi:DNA polymerase-4/DNA polymerase V